MLEAKLPRLKKNRVFIENLRFDVTPEVIFKPRFAHGNPDVAKETQGFSFYIEYLEGQARPALMLMKTYELRSKTIVEILNVPEELLWGAVRAPKGKEIAGMYPIDDALEGWIKKELT